ncbi:hypothetical protein L1987_06639 [Smallanthus sonchifolius]|uniref:Uncharacterized protein n=1 Tax=Smallanthus sonchifolius TaxID=185202 RepID=A0ACB9JYQ7_9ASTR|nr:hypothetical protein L1987_06639 [Smallanthus sonchifolius]
MPPRRAANANSSNPNTDLAALLTQLVGQMIQANNNSDGSNTQGNGANPPYCTFKHFNSCNPTKFFGTEGATGLLQWFESMESTFLNSDCPDNLKVRYAASVFQKRALTWWNGEKRTRGNESAMSLSWDEMQRLMTDEFCPRNEMRKLEAEFWDLTQDSGENLAYTTHFQELSLLVSHMVTPLAREIEKYIGGLPMPLQDTVLGSNPSTLEDAIRLSAVLTDNHVKAGTLSRKGTKKAVDKAATSVSEKDKEPESSRHDRKRKAQNFAVVTPAVPVTQVTPAGQILKNYVGSFPQCPTCKYHHAPHATCRLCSKCGRYGHVVTTCHARTIVNQATQGNHPMPLTVTYGRACYECGDPNHFRNQCPRLQNQGGPHGRAFNINANEAPANDDTVNGTFLCSLSLYIRFIQYSCQ